MEMRSEKLWKLLKERKLKKKTLADMAGISSMTLTNMAKKGRATMQTLLKICKALQCDLSDIIEIVKV